MKIPHKRNPEVSPPSEPQYTPNKNQEIVPKPDKNEPYKPIPEIKPNLNPEIKPEK